MLSKDYRSVIFLYLTSFNTIISICGFFNTNIHSSFIFNRKIPQKAKYPSEGKKLTHEMIWINYKGIMLGLKNKVNLKMLYVYTSIYITLWK